MISIIPVASAASTHRPAIHGGITIHFSPMTCTSSWVLLPGRTGMEMDGTTGTIPASEATGCMPADFSLALVWEWDLETLS
jgi:hypothetical protein